MTGKKTIVLLCGLCAVPAGRAAAQVAENYYRGIANIRLRVKDIKERDVIV